MQLPEAKAMSEWLALYIKFYESSLNLDPWVGAQSLKKPADSERQWGGRDCCAGNWGEGSGVETVDGL